MNGVIRETSERAGDFVNLDFGFFGAGGLGETKNRFDEAAKFALGEEVGGSCARAFWRLSRFSGRFHWLEKAVPIRTLRKRAGDAPWPVPMVCMGWPLPQLGVPHSIHWSREQMASMEFQNSVVIPEYDGFLNMRPSLPPLISHPISQPNWKL